MSYTKINWENLPSTKTPLNTENLNNIETEVSVSALHETLDAGTLKSKKGDQYEKWDAGVGIKKITSVKESNVVTLTQQLTDGNKHRLLRLKFNLADFISFFWGVSCKKC